MRIALDSNCVSYLIDACSGTLESTAKHAVEGVALIRIWFYVSERYSVSATALLESSCISDEPRREIHEAFSQLTYFGVPINDLSAVQRRADNLLLLHPRYADCLILAEAEDMEADTLLCCDNDFINRLSPISMKVKIMRPSEYWQQAAILKGATAKCSPEISNPLNSNTSWRW